jgi:hypothetical protein
MGMKQSEVYDLLDRDGNFQMRGAYGTDSFYSVTWVSDDEEMITLKFSLSDDGFRLFDKGMTPAHQSPVERTIRRIRRKLRY